MITINGTASTPDTAAIEVKSGDTLNKDVVFNLGENSAFTLTASGSTAGETVVMNGGKNDFTINGHSGDNDSFTFGAENADEKLQIKDLGTLTIQNNAKVTVTAGSGSATAGVDVYAETISVNNSTVNILQHVSGSAKQNAILRGKTINITGSDAVINLGSNETERSGGRATLGWRSEATLDATNKQGPINSGSKISLSNGATLNLIGHSGGNANAYNTQGSQVWGDSLTADKSFVEVSGAGAQIWTHTNEFTDTSFHVGNKAQLIIKTFEFRVMKDGKTDSDHVFSFINGTTTFNGGNLIVEGNLQVAGIVVINDNVNLTAGEAAFNKEDSAKSNELYNGVITVGLGSDFTSESDKAIETESILKISSTKLNEFLTASTTKTEYKDAQGSDKSYEDKGGILSFGAGKATLAFTDTTQVDLSKFNWIETDMSASGTGNTAEAGAIVYDTSLAGSGSSNYSGEAVGVTVSATNMLVSKALSEGAKKINLEADTLTLGSNNYSGTESLNFSGATARNLNVLAKSGDFLLNDTVTLRSISGTDNVVASDGTIQGDLAIASGKTFTVDGGIYQTNDDFTVNASGTLAVTNTKGANQSSLDLNRGIKFDLRSSGVAKVSVDGGLTGEYQAGNETYGKLTQLDLRAGITATGTTGTAKITATSGGVVLVDDSDLNKIFAAAGTSTDALSKVSFEIASGAALKAEGNVQMSFTDDNAQTLNKMLTLGKGGIFEADSLRIDAKFSANQGTAQGLGFTDATMRVGSLTFNNNTSGATAAYLTGGTYEVSNSLTVGNKLPLTLAAASQVEGEGTVTLLLDTGSNTATGTISASGITNESANGEIVVAQGAWTATGTDFTLTNGTMTVGEAGTQNTASLTAEELSVSGSGNFDVLASVGSATFDHLDAWWTDGVNVAGTLTINGDDVTVETEDNPVAVHTNANSINVASTGTLNFGSKAVYNSIFGGTSGAEVLLKDSFAENTIELAANGNVSLAFNDTTSLSAEQVVDLKKKLFANDTDGSILGFINLGGAKIESLEFGTDANGTPTITWDELKPVADVIGAGTGNDELAQAKVTDISSTDQFKSPVGSVVSTDGSVTVAGNSSFNNAAGNNGLFVSDTTGKVGNATVVNGSDVHLNGTGEIGTVSLNGSTAEDPAVLVTSNGSTNAPAKVTIASISGDAESTFSSRAAETAVTGDVDVGSMETLADTVTTVGGDVTVAKKADFAGTTNIKGNAEFAGAVDFSGITTFGGNVEIVGNADVTGNTTATAGNTTLRGDMTIAEGAAFTANNISLEATGQTLFVGTDSYTDENGEEQPGTTGYLDVANLSLNGNMLVVDPDYGEATSIAAIDDFDAAGYADDISAIHGTVVVG